MNNYSFNNAVLILNVCLNITPKYLVELTLFEMLHIKFRKLYILKRIFSTMCTILLFEFRSLFNNLRLIFRIILKPIPKSILTYYFL